MILKSYIVEQNIDILKNYKATLIYGENNGIKDDIKEEIRNKNENSDVINFFENDYSLSKAKAGMNKIVGLEEEEI